MTTENLRKLSSLISNIVGETIDAEEHIHIGYGRAYYIQPAVDGSPMLLRHYRGPIFIDLSRNDYNGINSGTIDAEEYIRNAHWLIGYYWGGGSMIGGGYYQPIDIINHSEEVKRYFRILSCRTNAVSSGYRPTEDRCANCTIKNCPFSSAECNRGNWEDESIREEDFRYYIFKLISKKFESQFPGYTIRGMLSSFNDADITAKECLVRANTRFQENDTSFTIFLSSEMIRGIMMRNISTEEMENLVDNMIFYHHKGDFNEEKRKTVTMESIAEVVSRPEINFPLENAKRKAEKAARIAAEEAETERIAAKRAKRSIFGFFSK